MAARDQWIGWPSAARRENLHLVVNNSRFLIRSEVKVPHLASHLLGQVLRRLPADWQARYGYAPVLVETFVQQGRFAGISYQAANWQAVGWSTGRGRQDGAHQTRGPKKVIWVYPLQKNFRQVLQTMPATPRLAPVSPRRSGPASAAPPSPADWAQQEFSPAPLQETRLQRRLCMEVRYRAVELKAPKRKARLPAVALWAVLAREIDPPVGIQPVEWMLLSTLAVESFAAAVEKLRWYAGRWGIEVFHRVLKSGCQIEHRQLAGADRLEACLAIDLVVAWRIFHLSKLGRETPEVPCTVYFEEHEWKALVVYVTQKPEPPPQPPSLREAVRMAASLGGFLGRKSDGEPGTQTLWLGLQRLDDLAAMHRVMSMSRDLPAVSSNRTYG